MVSFSPTKLARRMAVINAKLILVSPGAGKGVMSGTAALQDRNELWPDVELFPA